MKNFINTLTFTNVSLFNLKKLWYYTIPCRPTATHVPSLHSPGGWGQGFVSA